MTERPEVPGAGASAGRRTGRARRALGVAAPVVLLALTAGCGGSETDTYCETFLQSRQDLSDLAARQTEAGQKGGEGVDVLTPTLAAFEKLRGEAPDELRDEWDTLVFAYRDLAEAVEASGVDPAEFQVGQVPEEVDPADRRALARVASKLGSGRVVEAANGIEGYSAQVCEDETEDPGDGSDDQLDEEGLPTEEP